MCRIVVAGDPLMQLSAYPIETPWVASSIEILHINTRVVWLLSHITDLEQLEKVLLNVTQQWGHGTNLSKLNVSASQSNLTF
jgi:hypothetical protein